METVQVYSCNCLIVCWLNDTLKRDGIPQDTNTGKLYIFWCIAANKYLECIPPLRNSVCYRLVGAVIYHTLGNYTSYFLDNNQNQWFHADDAKVDLFAYPEDHE